MTYRSFSTFGTGASFLAGANILDIASIGVSGGILSENTTMITQAFEYINKEIVVHPEIKVDGIKPDGSFSQHLVRRHCAPLLASTYDSNDLRGSCIMVRCSFRHILRVADRRSKRRR
jgi:hypothetical protein